MTDYVVKRDESKSSTDEESAVYDVETTPNAGLKQHRMDHSLSIISQKYDLNHDGELDEDEQALRDLDDGTGTLNLYALVDKIREGRTQKQKLKEYRYAVAFLTFLAVLSVCANFGLVFVALHLSKDMTVSTSGVLQSTANGSPVRTAPYKPTISILDPTKSNEAGRRASSENVICDSSDFINFGDYIGTAVPPQAQIPLPGGSDSIPLRRRRSLQRRLPDTDLSALYTCADVWTDFLVDPSTFQYTIRTFHERSYLDTTYHVTVNQHSTYSSDNEYDVYVVHGTMEEQDPVFYFLLPSSDGQCEIRSSYCLPSCLESVFPNTMTHPSCIG